MFFYSLPFALGKYYVEHLQIRKYTSFAGSNLQLPSNKGIYISMLLILNSYKYARLLVANKCQQWDISLLFFFFLQKGSEGKQGDENQ